MGMRRLGRGLALAAILAGPASAQVLSELNLRDGATTVSGLSSGAYMAGQLHVAFSERIAGAALIAGGPYLCAEGSVRTALNLCTETEGRGPDSGALAAAARALAATGEIDPLSGLAGDRVYLFHGSEDRTVVRGVADAARSFYLAAGVAEDAIAFETGVAAGHGFPAPGAPLPCGVSEPPFVIDCGRDEAGELLRWLYGPLAAPIPADPTRLLRFSQGVYASAPTLSELDTDGFVYVPADCAAGAECRLHIALHGCGQGREALGDLYALDTGYNRWAEANRIVVLYPQAIASLLGGNPRGCWDWWGYDSPGYATQEGTQVAAIARMAAALGAPLAPAPVCRRHVARNLAHLQAGRAGVCGWGLCATGSGRELSGWWGRDTLWETSLDRFTTEPCGQAITEDGSLKQ